MTQPFEPVSQAALRAAAMNHLIDALVVATAGGEVALWSAETEALFGWSAAQARGRPLAELIVPLRLRERHLQAMRATLRRPPEGGATHGAGQRWRMRGMHRNGQELPVELTVNPFQHDGAGFFCVSIRPHQLPVLCQEPEAERYPQAGEPPCAVLCAAALLGLDGPAELVELTRLIEPADRLQPFRLAQDTSGAGRRLSGTAWAAPDASQEFDRTAQQRLHTEQALRNALRQGQFVLHYQPRIDAVSGRLAAVEALVRWRHPERGLLLPGEFLPLAEETGMVSALGAWVVRSACADVAGWQARGLPVFGVSVNLAPRQLACDGIVQVVEAALCDSGLAPHLLELEVTESGLMHNMAGAEGILGRLRNCGVGISIDQFGTGYSSLRWLQRLPIDWLKIDREFITQICRGGSSAAIVGATIDMAHAMLLRVVAEGVESAGQAQLLAQLGCDQFQGRYFGAAMASAELIGWLAARP